MASVTVPCISFRTTDYPIQLTRISNESCHRILLLVTRITSRGIRILELIRTIIDCKRKYKRNHNRNHRQRHNNLDISIQEIVQYRRYRILLKTLIKLRHFPPVRSVILYLLVPLLFLILGSHQSHPLIQSRYSLPNKPCTFICIIISNQMTFEFPVSLFPRFLIPRIIHYKFIITHNISIIPIIDTIINLLFIVYHPLYPPHPQHLPPRPLIL